MGTEEIDFDAALVRGLPSYGDVLGHWWLRQSTDAAHQRAYRNIARYIHSAFQRPLELVVDYACGPGYLLARLAWRYPHARFLGLDGSRFLLQIAQRRITRLGSSYARRIQLVESALPDFRPRRPRADLVVFAFPNIIPVREGSGFSSAESQLTAAELRILRHLSRQDGHGDTDPATLYSTLARDRVISLHLRSLLRKGGACVRVEYSNIRREEMSRAQTLRAMMEEGSLDSEVDGSRPRVWFRVLASSYFRSGVIADVHQQAGSTTSCGGYVITVLRAV